MSSSQLSALQQEKLSRAARVADNQQIDVAAPETLMFGMVR
jgi:hypothetical protein